jgi:hypothetical protein
MVETAPITSGLALQAEWDSTKLIPEAVKSISVAERLLAHVLLNPQQHLLGCRNDLRGVFKPRIKDKVLRINYCDSLGEKSMGPVSGGESRVAEISDYVQRHQRVHNRLSNPPSGTLPPSHLELVLKPSDERFPGVFVGVEV